MSQPSKARNSSLTLSNNTVNKGKQTETNKDANSKTLNTKDTLKHNDATIDKLKNSAKGGKVIEKSITKDEEKEKTNKKSDDKDKSGKSTPPTPSKNESKTNSAKTVENEKVTNGGHKTNEQTAEEIKTRESSRVKALKDKTGDVAANGISSETKSSETSVKDSKAKETTKEIPKTEKDIVETTSKEATKDNNKKLTKQPNKEVKEKVDEITNNTTPKESSIDDHKQNKKETGNIEPPTDTTKTSELKIATPKKPKDQNEKIVWDCEEMESLMMQVDYEASKTPKSQPTGKVLKLRDEPPSGTKPRYSPYKNFLSSGQPEKKNFSTIVNLSTVSSDSSNTIPLSGITRTPDKSYTAGIRSVSGRRSTRRYQESNIHKIYPESYRKLNESSLNVTVGSDRQNYSFRSEDTSIRSRKRFTTDKGFIADNPESPKRVRLDLSGFLGFVASPVTLLKQQLSRVKLQSSTPREKDLDCSDDEIVDTENISCMGVTNEIIDEPIADVKEDEQPVIDDIEINDLDDKLLFKENEEKLVETATIIDQPKDAIKKKWNCIVM